MKAGQGIRWFAMAGAAMVLSAWAWVGTRTPSSENTARVATTGAALPTRDAVGYDGLRAHAADLVAAALEPADAGADPLQVEPRLPRAAGTPCVVELFRDMQIPTMSVYDPNFTYTPPAACPGPWAKVKLIVELSGPREGGQPTSVVQLSLVGDPNPEGQTRMFGALWVGAPQITDDIPVWRMERDVTEYSAMLTRPRGGFIAGTFDNDNHDIDFIEDFGTALLVFYPATAATPAQRRANVVMGVANEPMAPSPTATLRTTFPRNVLRAYLDVTAKATGGPSRYWYACAPDDAFTRFPYLHNGYAIGDARLLVASALQGCSGGSYREVEVRIDGRLAGLAPVFPWLGSNINNNFRGVLDRPAPSVQALNLLPFRVDLTPFAGLLNNGAEHEVTVTLRDVIMGFVDAHLLLYTDPARAVVPGAVTRNTLAESTPTVTDTLSHTTFDNGGGDTVHHLTGQVTTRSVRSFTIEGYVDTSRGRIRSTVIQRNYFNNVNLYDVTSFAIVGPFEDYDADFGQRVRLTSSVDRTSRSVLGTTLLREDKLYSTYPLVLDYRHAGGNRSDGDFAGAGTDRVDLDVHQARALRESQFRRGTPRYTHAVTDIFDGSHHYLVPFLGGTGVTDWNTQREYLYTDNFAGCYSAAITTENRILETRTRGTDCPFGNQLRWWSHPDGSPDSMNWAPAP